MNKTTNTFEGGLVRLDNKTKQPKNSYSFALNAIINDPILDQTSRSNEQGFDSYLTIGNRPFVIMKAQWLGKEQYVFFIKHLESSVDKFNEIWYVDKEKNIQRLVYSNLSLNFQDDYEISSTYRIDYKTNRIVYWVDGLNDDRVINIDNVDSLALDISLLSIESSYTKAELKATTLDSGGSLKSGQYFLALSYNIGDTFTTSAFGLSNPISIASKDYYYPTLDSGSTIPAAINKQFGDTDGDLGGTPTKKAFSIDVTNLDSNFDSINLVVIYNDHTTTSIKVVKKISIKDKTTVTYKYTGNTGELDTTIDVSDITVDSVRYYASEVIAQKENRLVRGNSKMKASSINYQSFANNIKVGYSITEELVFEDNVVNYKTTTSPPAYDPTKELYKQHSASPVYLAKTAQPDLDSKTFMRDEVYSLGVGFELIDGSETDIMHIPGRQLNTFESSVGTGEYDRVLSTNLTTWDNDTVDGELRWQKMNTAVKRTGVSELAYWESDQDYTSGYNFPTGKIRHHKMPSDVLEPIYRTEVTNPNVADTPVHYKIYKRHLSLNVSNIIIPTEYQGIIKKIKIYYTPRNVENKSILSKGLLYNLDTTETPMKQPQHLNYNFTDSGKAATKFEFVSPEVNFNFKQASLAASKMKVCGIDKGYVTYLGLDHPQLTADSYLTRMYNNELHDTKQREQDMFNSICFYNQRAIPKEHLYDKDVTTAIFLDSNFVGSSVGFDVDYMGGQKTALLEVSDPLVLLPIVLVNRKLNAYYPELNYASAEEQPSKLFRFLNKGIGTTIPNGQMELNYDTTYYVSLINENKSLYGAVETLEYVNSGAFIFNDGTTTLEVKSGDTFIDVHHFKKTHIELIKPGDDIVNAYNIETTGPDETIKPINEHAIASYCSFFVETDLNIRMRREGSKDNEKYFPKSFYSGVKMRDLGRMIDEEEYYKIEEGYNQNYLKLYFANAKKQQDFIDQTDDIRYSTRLIYSDKQSLEDKTDRYRIVRVNNYRDLPLDRGPVSGLFTKQEKLFAITRDSLFDIYASNQTIKTENGDNLTVGTGEFFANEPTEIMAIEGGFGGTTSKYSICETPYGYLYVDRFKGKCILFGDSIKDINVLGLNEDFTLDLFKQIPELLNSEFDNPLSNAGIISIYDPKLKRIIVSKKDYKLLAPYVGVYNPTTSYTVGQVVFKDEMLKKVDGIVDTNIINQTNFSDWTIDNTNLATNNMQVIDAPTMGTVTSTTPDGINYDATVQGADTLTVNQSGHTCGAKETITIDNTAPAIVPVSYTMTEGSGGFVDNNLLFYLNDTPTYSQGVFNASTGYFNNGRIGDVVTVLQDYYGGSTDPDGNVVTAWSGPVRATLVLKVDGIATQTLVTEYDAPHAVGNLQNLYFTLAEGHTYEVICEIIAKVMVPVNYSVAYGLNPITQNGLILMRNGVEVKRAGAEESGTVSNVFYQGDTINIRQFTYGDAYPWEAGSKANLSVTMNGVSAYNVDDTVQDIEVQSYSVLIPDTTTTMAVSSTGSSTATGYVTKVVNTTSNTSNLKIHVTDTTTPKIVLKISDSETGSHTYPYNLYVDGNTQTVELTNKSATNTIEVTINGGSVISLAPLAVNTVTGITKDSININITQI